MGEGGLAGSDLDGGVTAEGHPDHAHRRDAHDATVAGTAPARGVVALLRRAGVGMVTEHLTGVDADVVRIVCPCTEPGPQVVGLEATDSEQRLGQGERHLGVVGELAGGPVESTPTDHLAVTAQHG